MTGVWHCDSCDPGHRLAAGQSACPLAAPGQGRASFRPDYAALRDWRPAPADRTMWRFAPLLPVYGWHQQVELLRSRFPVGGTPMARLARLGGELGLNSLWAKNETVNPTGALKDRPSALVVVAALAGGQTTVATASSGNAAAALAAAAATVGLRCIVFVPRHTPQAKAAQIAAYGAHLVIVDGDYDSTARLCAQACEEFGWYSRNTAANPYTAEGKKTVALEVAEMLRPDAVVVPVGDGNMIFGLYRGFADAVAMGWLERMPRLIGVQAAGASAVWRAWKAGDDDVTAQAAQTVAESISVGDPADGRRALAAVRHTGGCLELADDGQIADAAEKLALTSGMLAEPASAAAIAALAALSADGRLRADETVVAIVSGRGPKSTPATPPVRLTPPTLQGVAQACQAF